LGKYAIILFGKILAGLEKKEKKYLEKGRNVLNKVI
jgi:hypothetical protein